MRSSTIHRLPCCGRNNTTNNRKHAVSTIIQVLFITLRLLASGSFLQVITDNFLGFDESTARRVVGRVTQALTTKLGDFERFPSTRAERDDIKEGFFRFGGFPYAIQFIDVNHVRIAAPRENEPDFMNRKGFQSIKMSMQSAAIEVNKYV